MPRWRAPWAGRPARRVGRLAGRVGSGRVGQAGTMGDEVDEVDEADEADEAEVLQGGVGNAGAVVRVGPHVLRPTSAHTPAIHRLLGHLHDVGFHHVPRVVTIEPDGRERLEFIEGDVPVVPFPAWWQTDRVLASTAALLRRFHDATVGFDPGPPADWSDELADPAPRPDAVLCHNDVCPENVVYRRGTAVALLDFEFAAPGRRVWDLASLARMCVPIDTDDDAARTGRRGLDPCRRLAVVADAYGLDDHGRVHLLEVLAHQVDTAGSFVRRRVEAGEPAFIAMWEAMGGQERYDRRRRWFHAERDRFAAALGLGG